MGVTGTDRGVGASGAALGLASGVAGARCVVGFDSNNSGATRGLNSDTTAATGAVGLGAGVTSGAGSATGWIAFFVADEPVASFLFVRILQSFPFLFSFATWTALPFVDDPVAYIF